MKVAFMIIHYNDLKSTMTLLDQIKDYQCIDKILVVDNGSTDDSYNELAPCQSSHIEILHNPINRGYGAGINYGVHYLEQKQYDSVFISNSDILIADETVLKQLLQDQQQGYSIVAPVINQHGEISRGWKIPTPGQEILQSIPYFYKKFLSKNLYPDSHYQASVVPVEVVSGCFFLIKIVDLKEAGYYDENVFLYYEENILATKLKQKGKSVAINPTIEVIHNHSVTIDKAMDRKRKYKALSKSRRYFNRNYNGANSFFLFLFWFFEKIMLFGFTVKQWITF